MAASESAVADSGIDFQAYPAETCGVLIGSGIGGLNEFETQHETMVLQGAVFADQPFHHPQADA